MSDHCPHCHKSITKVDTVEDVFIYTYQKRSLFCPSSHAWSKPKPAAVFQNLSAKVLVELIRHGLFVYQKESDVAYDKQGWQATEHKAQGEVTT